MKKISIQRKKVRYPFNLRYIRSMVFVFKQLKKSTTSRNLSRVFRIFYTEQTEHIRIFSFA